MENNKLYLIIAFAIIIVCGIAYYAYGEYNNSQSRNYLLKSDKLSDEALSYSETLFTAMDNKNYNESIAIINKVQNKFKLAITEDKKALQYAQGNYKQYTVYDIMRLQKNINATNMQLEMISYLQKGDNTTATEIEKDVYFYSDQSQEYRNLEDELIIGNPAEFKFLN